MILIELWIFSRIQLRRYTFCVQFRNEDQNATLKAFNLGALGEKWKERKVWKHFRVGYKLRGFCLKLSFSISRSEWMEGLFENKWYHSWEAKMSMGTAEYQIKIQTLVPREYENHFQISKNHVWEVSIMVQYNPLWKLSTCLKEGLNEELNNDLSPWRIGIWCYFKIYSLPKLTLLVPEPGKRWLYFYTHSPKHNA